MRELLEKIKNFNPAAERDEALVQSIRADIRAQINNVAQLKGAGGDRMDADADFAYLLDALPDASADIYTSEMLQKLDIIQHFRVSDSESKAEAKSDDQQKALDEQAPQDMACHEMQKAFQHKLDAKKIAQAWPCPPPVTRANQLAHYDNIEKLQKYIADVNTRLVRMAAEDEAAREKGVGTSSLLFNYMQLGEFLRKLYPYLTARQRRDQLSALVPHFSSPATAPILSEKDIIDLETQASSLESKKTALQEKADSHEVKSSWRKTKSYDGKIQKVALKLGPAKRRAREARQPKYKIDVVACMRRVFEKEQPLLEAQQTAGLGLLSCEYLLGHSVNNESPTDEQMSITETLIGEWGDSTHITELRLFQNIIDAIEHDARTLDTPQKRVKGKLLATNKLQGLLNDYFTDRGKFLSTHGDLLNKDTFKPARHPLLIVLEDKTSKAEASLSTPDAPFQNWSSILKRETSHLSDEKEQKNPGADSKDENKLGDQSLLSLLSLGGGPPGPSEHKRQSSQVDVGSLSLADRSFNPATVLPASGRDMSQPPEEDSQGLRKFLEAVEKFTPESKGGTDRLAVALEEASIRGMAFDEYNKIAEYARKNKDAGAMAIADYAADLFHMLEESSSYTFDYTPKLQRNFWLIFEFTSYRSPEQYALSELYGIFTRGVAVKKIAKTLPVSSTISLADHYANADKLNNYKNAIQNFFAELPLADEENGNKIERLVLLCVQMGELLTKMYPGLDPRNISTQLPIIIPSPDSRPFRPQVLANIEDAVTALRAALIGLSPGATQQRAMLGLQCYERLIGKPPVAGVVQIAVNNPRKLVAEGFLVGLAGTTTERHKFQRVIDAIARNARNLSTPVLRVKGKELVMTLQELLDDYFIDPVQFKKNHPEQTLEFVFTKNIVKAEKSLSSSNPSFEAWSALFTEMVLIPDEKERKHATMGGELQRAPATPESRSLTMRNLFAGMISDLTSDDKRSSNYSVDLDMIELLEKIERFKNSQLGGKRRQAAIAAAVRDKIYAVLTLTSGGAGNSHDPTLLASYLLDALPGPSYPYSGRITDLLQTLIRRYEARRDGGTIASACYEMYQAIEVRLRHKKMSEAWQLPVDTVKSYSEHYANVEKLDKYFTSISQRLNEAAWQDPSTLPELLLAYVQMGEFLTKLYPPPHTAVNIRTQLFRIIPLFPPIPLLCPLPASATDVTRNRTAKDIAQMRHTVAVMRQTLAAAAVDSPQAAAAQLGLMLHNQLLGDPSPLPAVGPVDQKLVAVPLALTQVFAQGSSGWDATAAQRVAFQNVIDQIGAHARGLKTSKERVTGKELTFKLQAQLDRYFIRTNLPTSDERYRKFLDGFRGNIIDQEKILSTPQFKFEAWSTILRKDITDLGEDKKEEKKRNLSAFSDSPQQVTDGNDPGKDGSLGRPLEDASAAPTFFESKRSEDVSNAEVPEADQLKKQMPFNRRSTFLSNPLFKSISTYFTGPLFKAALFVMLGFAIVSASPLVFPGSFLSGAIVIAPMLVVVALAFIANIAMHWVKSNHVSAVPTCQAVASALEVAEILRRYPHSGQMKAMLNKALLVHIQNAYEVLHPESPWHKGLVGFVARGGKTVTKKTREQLEEEAQTLLVAKNSLQSSLDLEEASIRKLQIIFSELATAKVDPTFRPAISSTRTALVTLFSTALLAGCVTVLAMIFTGIIGIATINIVWSMSLAAGLGFLSWLGARYVINNTSGSHYTQWAALLAVPLVTFLTLWAFMAAGFNVGLSNLAPSVGPSGLALFGIVAGLAVGFIFFAAKAWSYASARGQQREAKRKQGAYRGWAIALTVMKIVLALGFLLLAFLSIAALFNLSGLGPFNRLMTFASAVIDQMAGSKNHVLGTKWFISFGVGIVASASFIAFELFRSALQKAPASASDFHKHTGQGGSRVSRGLFSLAPVLFKSFLILGPLIGFFILAAKNHFLPGAKLGLFPIYLIVALMSVVGGNTRMLPESWKIRFNAWFGLNPSHASEGVGYFIKKELRVLVVLAALLSFALLPGVPTLQALMLLGMGGGMTLVFRWGTMLWNAYVTPEVRARDYLESSLSTTEPSVLSPLPPAAQASEARTLDLTAIAASSGGGLGLSAADNPLTTPVDENQRSPSILQTLADLDEEKQPLVAHDAELFTRSSSNLLAAVSSPSEGLGPRSGTISLGSPAVPAVEKKRMISSLRQGVWFSLSAALLALLVMMITAGGPSLSTGWYFTALLFVASAVSIGFLVRQRKQEWSLYGFKERLEFGLMALGVAGLAILAMLTAVLPMDVLFSSAVLLPLMAVTAMLVSYFFGKQKLLESPIEATWRLLAVPALDNKSSQIEALIKKQNGIVALGTGSISPDEKRLLLHFLDIAIEARGRELLFSDNAGKLAKEDNASRKKDLLALGKYRANVAGDLQAVLLSLGEDVLAICSRFKTCQISPDSNTMRKKTTMVLLFATIFIAAVIFVFSLSSIASIFSEAQIGGFIIAGLAVVLLAVKGLMEWSRQHAISYNELTGKTQRPSQRITGERLMVWMSNMTLFTLTIMVSFLWGVRSTPFLSMALIAGAWGIGQIFASRTIQSLLKEPQVQQPEISADTIHKPQMGLQTEELKGAPTYKAHSMTEEKQVENSTPRFTPVLMMAEDTSPDETKSLLPSEDKKGKDQKAARSYFNIRTPANGGVAKADVLMRSCFVTAAILGLGYHHGYANPYFNTTWNAIDLLGSIPGIHANRKNNWKDGKSGEKGLIVFEILAEAFLAVTTVFSHLAKTNTDFHVLQGDHDLIARLSTYGFAVAMTASAARGFKDFMIAWDECSPRFLLESKLKKYQGMAEATEEDKEAKAQLYKEILAIAHVKRHELLETGEQSVEDIFRNSGITDPEILNKLQASATEEETLFVETLLKRNEEKCNETLAEFLACLTAMVCFWLLALNPIERSLSLDTFGGGANIFLVLSGMIKLRQLLVSGYNWCQDYKVSGLRDKFLLSIANEVNQPQDLGSVVNEIDFGNFFDGKNIPPEVQANYRIVYYLRQHEISPKYTIQSFLENLYKDPEKDKVLKAALDEFIILAKSHTQGDKNCITETLNHLAKPDASRLKGNVSLGNVELRGKAVTSILKSGFFSKAVTEGNPPPQVVGNTPSTGNDRGVTGVSGSPLPDDPMAVVVVGLNPSDSFSSPDSFRRD